MKIRFKYYWYNFTWKVHRWFYDKSPIYIYLNFWECIKDYCKARKVFLKPAIVKHVLTSEDEFLGSNYFLCDTLGDDHIKNKWFYINCHNVGYKSKWNDLVFESVPYISIKLGKKLYIYGFESPVLESYSDGRLYTNNHLYYEAILQYVYQFKGDIIKTYNNNIWSRPLWDYKNDEGKIYNIPITIINMLKPSKERDKLVEEINKQTKEKENKD